MEASPIYTRERGKVTKERTSTASSEETTRGASFILAPACAIFLLLLFLFQSGMRRIQWEKSEREKSQLIDPLGQPALSFKLVWRVLAVEVLLLIWYLALNKPINLNPREWTGRRKWFQVKLTRLVLILREGPGAEGRLFDRVVPLPCSQSHVQLANQTNYSSGSLVLVIIIAVSP